MGNSKGQLLSKVRKQKGLTQSELAEKVGVSVVTLQNWESGRTKWHKLSRFAVLCEALGIDVNLANLHSMGDLKGRFIRKMREQKGITQSELARQMDVSVTTFQNWESGKAFASYLGSLAALLEALDISVKAFIELGKTDDDFLNTVDSENESLPDLRLTLQVDNNAEPNEVANELATLCKALNAYHIACGGNGLEIDDWETLIAVRELVGV